MTSSEDVLLQVSHVKHKKDDGHLYLMSERVAWIQGNKDTVTLSHKYADIKSQKISSEGKPKIQLQVVLHNGSTFTFHFVHPDGLRAQIEARNQVKELLMQLIPKFRREVDKELEAKSRILAENPALLQLYKELVGGGIITVDEFWDDHAARFVSSNKKSYQSQDVGVESGFLSDIKPQTDGNGLHYNLTPNIIESIFKTYPAVRKKHRELVPAKMNEAQFWTKFFQSHYFHRDRMPVSTDTFSDCAKADDKEMRKELEKVKEANSKVLLVLEDPDPLNVDGDANTQQSKSQPAATGVLKTMIKRFNQHSIMVLKACERNKSEQSALPESVDAVDAAGSSASPAKKPKLDEDSPEPDVEYEDLGEVTTENFKNLQLAEVDRYLNGPVGSYDTDSVPQDTLLQSVVNMRAYSDRWLMKPQLLDAKTAGQILSELSPGGALMQTTHREESLPPEIEVEMRNLYIALGELLRHFWCCFPATTPALQDKLKKSHETLKKFEQVKVQKFKERLLRDHLNSTPLLAHVTAMLNQADNKYHQWAQRSQKLK